jgi:hypothetical protein
VNLSSPTSRNLSLDVLRGGLLLAMLGVHVAAAHATSAQASALHGWFGVFLISSGFVALSGYLAGARPPEPLGSGLAHALDTTARLLLVMLVYAALASLLRHGLALAEGGAAACAVRTGWSAPARFESLGILLPIAIVQLLAPLSRGRTGQLCLGLLAVGAVLLPWATAAIPPEGAVGQVVGVLARRSVTPFYTVSTFVAVGLVGVLLGCHARRLERLAPAGIIGRLAAGIGAVLLAIPHLGQPILDGLHGVFDPLGALATLVWWSAVVLLTLLAFVHPLPRTGPVAGGLALLGRHSLFVFVLHAFALELDTWLRGTAGLDKGLGITVALFASNAVLLFVAALAVERWEGVRRVFASLLLTRARPAVGALGLYGAVGFAGVLGIYSGAAASGPEQPLVIDDWEGAADCPQWWQFGNLQMERVHVGGEHGHVLQVRGTAPGMFAHGTGTYLMADIGPRRTLELDLRGDGPRSGRLKIELLEDDNGNWEIEKDPVLFSPLWDDRWVFELRVDWSGWRRISIPAELFRDDNPSGGNNIFDPVRELTSGGLLEMQFLFAPSGPEDDRVHLDLDNVRWTR